MGLNLRFIFDKMQKNINILHVILTSIKSTIFPGKSIKKINEKPTLDLIVHDIVESRHIS